MKTAIILLIGLIVLNLYAKAQVQDATGYFEKLMREFVKILEKTEITGNGLPLSDWSGTLNTSLYGITATGTVKFNSGFVNSIEVATMDNRITSYNIMEEYVRLHAQFNLKNVRLFYDMDIEFTEYTGSGSIVIQIPQIQYLPVAFHYFKTNEKTLEFPNATFTVHGIESKQFPNNGYTQIINKQMSQGYFHAELVESIKVGWKDILQNHLDAVIAVAENPEICYNCNQLEL